MVQYVKNQGVIRVEGSMCTEKKRRLRPEEIQNILRQRQRVGIDITGNPVIAVVGLHGSAATVTTTHLLFLASELDWSIPDRLQQWNPANPVAIPALERHIAAWLAFSQCYRGSEPCSVEESG